MQKDESNLANLSFIPQVTLLSNSNNVFKPTIDSFLKRIICQDSSCSDSNLCNNCQKLADSCYFDLTWYKFNQSTIMKKQDVASIINNLSYQSVDRSPRICVIEAIEYSSLEASNMFLKFLENLPNDVFLIFTSTNIEKVLPTIKSRSQVINLSSKDSDSVSPLLGNDLAVVKDLVTKFIDNDNKKEFSSNFFLIKEILQLKDKIDLFFQFLLALTQNKIISDQVKSVSFIQENNDILENWKNNDQSFLINLIEVLSDTIKKLHSTKNLNLNLLLNYFFITIYQGQSNEF